ncbi:MAG: hypothetical protein QNL68_08880, partial [Akkermansiaceae bacterium]
MKHARQDSLFRYSGGLGAGFLLIGSGFAEVPPAEAIAGLDVGEGLEASLFASEPMMLSPSSIDIDHLGRVWVCEVVNY